MSFDERIPERLRDRLQAARLLCCHWEQGPDTEWLCRYYGYSKRDCSGVRVGFCPLKNKVLTSPENVIE
jgi:hypothetical protein